MKSRLIEIGVFAGASLGLSYYVGGVGLATVFFSALFMWLVFSAYDFFPSSSRYLASLVISTVIPVFAVVALVPQLGKVAWLRSIAFTPPSTVPTDYISITPDTLGTTRPWVLFVITGLLLCLIAMLIVLGNQYSKISEDFTFPNSSKEPIATRILRNAFPAISRYVVLTPLLALSYLQSQNHTKALAFMMSGDSRNIFRIVMRTRVTSSYPSIRELFLNGKYGEILASSLSAMNGTEGFPRIPDLIAMRSTYLIVFCLVVASISVLFTAAAQKWNPTFTPIRDTTIAVISVVVLFSPYPFAEILRSGFFSFFVGLGFLTATLAFLVPIKMQRLELLAIAYVAALATYFSYQPAVLIVVPLLCVLTTTFLWKRSKSKAEHILILVAILATTLISYGVYRPTYDRLVIRVRGSGEIWPTDTKFTTYVFLISIVLCILSRGKVQRLLIKASTLVVSAIATLQLIDFARGSDVDLYYLMKFRYATNFVSGVLCLALIAAIFNEDKIWVHTYLKKTLQSKVLPFIRGTLLVGLVGGFFIIVSDRTQAPSPVSLMRQGWDTPSSLVVQKTFELWREDTLYIFAAYFNEANDRMANFWSPYFWEVNRWEWTYAGYSVSVGELCKIIGTNQVNLYTKTIGFREQMDLICLDVSKLTNVLSIEKDIFDFINQPDK
jgi:hypothetical protein